MREIRANDEIVISTTKTGAVTGVVNKKYLTLFEVKFEPYLARVTAKTLNVRASASAISKVVAQVKEK